MALIPLFNYGKLELNDCSCICMRTCVYMCWYFFCWCSFTAFNNTIFPSLLITAFHRSSHILSLSLSPSISIVSICYCAVFHLIKCILMLLVYRWPVNMCTVRHTHPARLRYLILFMRCFFLLLLFLFFFCFKLLLIAWACLPISLMPLTPIFIQFCMVLELTSGPILIHLRHAMCAQCQKKNGPMDHGWYW